MPETTITNLPDGQTPGVSATRPLSGTERVPMDQGATTVDATTQDIADLAGAAITSAVSAHAAAADPHAVYLLESDPAVTDARTPTAHAGTHATAGGDPLTPADIGAATAAQGSLADSATQPGDLATVATTGAYADLTGLPSLGGAAALSVGTTAGTVAAGDDGRLSDARTPTDHAATHATGQPDELTPADIGAATAAQGGLADSAVQPGDLSTVATTGAYADLSGPPPLGTAAAADTGDFATAAQGGLADSAVQPSDLGTAAVLNVGTGANQVVQLNGSSQLPAVDGSLLTNLSGGASGLDDLTDVVITTPSTDQVLKYNGTSWVNGATAGGGDALTSGTLAQFASTTSDQLRGVISNETGTDALVFANAPTLVAPILGTPGSGTLTNCTGLPAAGVTGLGTLATQSGTFSGTSSGTNTGDQTITLTGDVTGTGTGSFAATVANNAVTYAKIQNVTATDRLLGRVTAGAGDVEEITCTAAGRNLIDDADATAQRTTLGLGSAAEADTADFATAAQGTDSREWTADTIAEAEAEAGAETTRRAFTALRVRQAVVAWWATISSTVATAAQGAKADTALQVVNHAADANVARPTGAPAVYWIGTIEPVNAADGDLWIGGV